MATRRLRQRDMGIRADGFRGQRMIVLPRPLVAELSGEPFVAGLYATDVGHFPRAVGHVVRRPAGCDQLILIYCVSGAGWVQARSAKPKPVPAGTSLLIPRRCVHAYGADRQRPWTIYWLHMQGRLLPQLASSVGLHDEEVRFHVGDDRTVQWLFEEVIRTLGQPLTIEEMRLASSAVQHLVGRLLYLRRRAVHESRPIGQRLADVVAFVGANPMRSFTLAELAAVARLSPSHLSGVFKARFGHSPVDYAHRMRMREAARLLDASNTSVGDVARAAGFDDPLYFSRAFRRVYGMPPSVYRGTQKG